MSEQNAKLLDIKKQSYFLFTIETVKIIPGAFDKILDENDHEIKRDLFTTNSQITSKPSSVFKEKIEYFKIASNGHEHLRKRVDSAKVMVGINGHPSEEETNVKSESVQSKKRIPLSWEDQLLNFPEEVKTVIPKGPVPSPQPKNCCEHYRILSQLPTSKLVWRQMAKPYSLNHWTNTKSLNSPPEQSLPSSPSFIKGTQLKTDLAYRYISQRNEPQAVIDTKVPKIQIVCSKPRAELPTTTKDEMISLQICKIRAPHFHALTIDGPVNHEHKVLQRSVQEQSPTKKTPFKKKHKFTILPLARPKPFPRDPKVMDEYFHVKKMDTWLQSSSDENKKRKSRENSENIPASVDNQNLSPDNGVQSKNQSSFEKESHMTNTAVQTDKKETEILTVIKPLSLKGIRPKVIAQDVQDKSTQVKNPSVIHFRIPYCGYWKECEMPEGREDQVTGGHSHEESGSNSKLSTAKRFPDEREKKTRTFTRERPKTR